VAHGKAENLGWVKDEKNAKIRAKMRKIFAWFDEHAGEDSPDSIVLRIKLTEATIFDYKKKYDESQYKVNFINKSTI